MQPTEESYILREYFKGFLPSQPDLLKIKEKINKINRENLLSSVIDQDKQIYHLISSNYKNTYEIIDKITTHINNLRSKLTNLPFPSKSPSFQTDIPFFLRLYDSPEEETYLTSSIEPFSIKKINSILYENQNKLQQYKNDITAIKNITINKLNYINDQTKYLDEIIKEKDFFIENIDEDFHIESSSITNIQFEVVDLLCRDFLFMNDKELYYKEEDMLEEKKRKVIIIINKKSKKEIKKKLGNVDEKMIGIVNDIQLNKIKNTLEIVKNSFIKNKEYAFRSEREFEKNDNENNNNNNKNENVDILNDDFFYFVYKSLRGIYDVIGIKRDIILQKKIISQEDIKMKEIQKEIEIINKRILFFETLKKQIEYKYEQILDNNIINSNINISINNTMNSNITSLSSPKDNLNELKILINKMETNYIQLLKNLSKKIIKPKNLVRKPEPSFFQNKKLNN